MITDLVSLFHHIRYDVSEIDIKNGTISVDKIVLHIVTGLTYRFFSIGLKIGKLIQISRFSVFVSFNKFDLIASHELSIQIYRILGVENQLGMMHLLRAGSTRQRKTSVLLLA